MGKREGCYQPVDMHLRATGRQQLETARLEVQGLTVAAAWTQSLHKEIWEREVALARIWWATLLSATAVSNVHACMYHVYSLPSVSGDSLRL